MLEFAITALVTAVSLLIISRLPLGIEVDSTEKALLSAIVFGVLNGFLKPILFWLTIPFTIVTLGLFLLVLNAFIFGLAAWLVEGFRLRWGLLSAFLGTIALSLTNSILFKILDSVAPNLVQ